MVVDASSIDSIDMDIYVRENGDAVITETWDAYVDVGTEGYHPYYNIGNSVISDLSVSMDGEMFTTIGNWDVNDSFNDKAYKAGIYSSGNEVDVCFGISEYGDHEYVIRYTISNFVSSLNDYDMVYWNLFPYDFSAVPGNVRITLYSDFEFDDDILFYTFGKGDNSNKLEDGKIIIDSNGSVSSEEYITLLVGFPKGLFNSSNILDNNFEYYYDMAMEGAINYNDSSVGIISIIIVCFIWGIILLVIFIAILSADSKKYHYKFGNRGNKVDKNVPNFRDIPCNKDIYRAYWVAYQYGMVTKKEDFLGVILLKWLKEGNVRVEKLEENGLIKKKVRSNIIFVNFPVRGIELEKDLYSWMYEASGDGKLESSEFTKWCRRNYSKIIKWFDDVIEFECKMLVNEEKISILEKKKLIFFDYNYYNVDDSMMKEAEEMYGLKKFLLEFTLIREREPIEVHLWNEYLMYAQIFGIAKEVASQFEKLYPEVIEDMGGYGYDFSDVLFIYTISRSGMSSARSAANFASSGSSFSGGGGGSFGGGGGGGGFR